MKLNNHGNIAMWILVIFLIAKTVVGCVNVAGLAPNGNKKNAPVRILALGDSYTIGTGVEPDQRWPIQLAVLLRQSGFEVGETLIIARNGWTTGDLLERIARAELSGTFDLVSLQIGVNNQYRGYPENEYRSEFRELLAIAMDFSGGREERVVVLSIPDWGAAPFAGGLDRSAIGAEIDAFNGINREETIEAGAHYLDVTGLSRKVLEKPELAAEDGLHLSGEMYKMWAQMVLDLITPTLLEGWE
jgi:lysophospholipase L1-like esterase